MKDDRERNLFCFTDEIWPNNSEWMYISSIFLEKSAFNELTDNLLDARYMTGGWRDSTVENWKNVDKESDYFPKNNEVVKFSKLEGSANKMNIARRWIDILEEKNLDGLKVKIIGVNVDRMDKDVFGNPDEDRENRIYSRLYRSLIKGGLRYFYEKEVVKNVDIIHDVRPRDGSDFSKILRALNTADISIGKIGYLDDNHRKADNKAEKRGSNLIQLCDLLAGCCSKMFKPEEVGPDREELVERFATLVRKSREYHEYWSSNLDTASFPEENLPEEGFFSGSAGLNGEMYERDIQVNSNYRKKDSSLERFL